jgi:hypothetical protein
VKRIWFLIVLLALLVSACAPKAAEGDGASLAISDGTNEKTYSTADLQALPATQAAFNGVTYAGVSVTDLLKAAGYDPAAVKAVKAVASDGFSVNYEPTLFTRADMIVAYAQADGPLTADDGSFRIVLPEAEGKLNPRMLVRLEVIQ